MIWALLEMYEDQEDEEDVFTITRDELADRLEEQLKISMSSDRRRHDMEDQLERAGYIERTKRGSFSFRNI